MLCIIIGYFNIYNMKKIIILLIWVLGNISLLAQNYFSKLYHLEYPEFGAIPSVITAKDGSYYFPYDIANVKADSSLLHLIKVNNKGDTLWVKKYGISKKKYAYSPRNIYFLPNEDILIIGDIFKPDSVYGSKSYGIVQKLDKYGNQKWLKEYSDGSYICKLIEGTICSDGNYLFTGLRRTYNAQSKSENYADPYIIKIDSLGNIVWQTVIADYFYQSEVITDVVETANKDFLMVGYRYSNNTGWDNFILKLNDKGQKTLYDWYGSGENNETSLSLIPSDDGNYILSGLCAVKKANSIQEYKSIISKINIKGERIWTKSYGEQTEYFTYNKLLELPNGDFIGIGGQDKKPYRCGATKFDKEGNVKWHRSYLYDTINGDQQYIWGGDVTKDNGIIMSGLAFNDLPSPKGSQGWLLKLDSLGCDKPGCATNTSTEEISAAVFFSVFPNPSSDKISIAINKENHEDFRVEFLDIQGRILFNTKILAQNSSVEIDVNNYTSGIYFVKVSSSSISEVQKVLITH